VLTARLRDARFFFDADRRTALSTLVPRLQTLLFHKKAGSYHAKAQRLERLTSWVAAQSLGSPALAEAAGTAGRLAKTDLVTDMVRELTELQGTMGGIYAREEGQPEAVWKAIYHQYLPVAIEAEAAPSRADLGTAATTWAALAVADKIDTLVTLFAAGERPTGTRDPFGLRRQAHGLLKVLVDLPELTGLPVSIDLLPLTAEARRLLAELAEGPLADASAGQDELVAFLAERLRYLFQQRGYGYDEVNAVAGSRRGFVECPHDARLRLEAIRQVRASADFEALAVAFKRVKNLARELKNGPVEVLDRLTEPAERQLLDEFASRGEAVRAATARREYAEAFRVASGFRPAVDRFFTDVFVMVDDAQLRDQRLTLIWRLHELLLDLADISEIVPQAELNR
jgi:glycyl-tRNA synthetase beta chain